MGLIFGKSLRIRRGWKRLFAGATVCAGLLAGSTGVAGANPTGATVRNGQVQISPGVHTQIQQLTDRAIVDWQSFSIGETESVVFLQPSQMSVILNRVTGGDASAILGSLQANGNVFLINPNGILFGPNSVVSVGGLVASTLNLTDEDFLAGNYSFFAEEGVELGAVVNQGQIKITDGGYAVLTGPSVINEGTIVARAGNVVLAAGEQATLNLDGRDLVHFALSGQVTEGAVLLAPGALSERLSDVLGVNPSLRADSLVQDLDGSVRLANASGTLVQAGNVSVDGYQGHDAGSVLLDSSDVTIVADGSVTSASGSGLDSNGGEVLVLSAMDGSNTARGFTDVQQGSLLAASGGSSGDGGFIEVSGDGLNLHGDVDLSASNGELGSFLLDPVVVTIVDGDNAPSSVMNPLTLTMDTIIGDAWFENTAPANLTLESAGDILFDLATTGTNPTGDMTVDFSNNNITLVAGTDAGEVGDIDFGDDGTTYQGLTSLTLAADGQVRFGDGIFDVDGIFTVGSIATPVGSVLLESSVIQVDTSGGGSDVFTIRADGLLDLGTSSITIREVNGDANFLLETTNGGDIDSGSSTVTFDAVSNLAVTSTIRADGDILSTGALDYALDGTTLFQATNGMIDLPELDLEVLRANTTGGSSLTIDAQNGTLDLSDASIDVVGNTTLTSTGNMSLDNLNLIAKDLAGAPAEGNIAINSTDGSVTFVDGSVNNGAGLVETGTFVLTAAGPVSLGETDITVDVSSAAPEVFTIMADGLLDLGTSIITIREVSGDANFLLETTNGGDIDLGSSTVTFDAVSNTTVTSTIRADGDILSTGALDYALDGTTLFQANGLVDLPELDLEVLRASTTGGSSLTIDAQNGTLDLSDASIDVVGNTTLTSTGNMSLDNLNLIAKDLAGAPAEGNIAINSTGGSVTFVDGSVNNVAGLVETGTFVLTAAGPVSLGETDITVDVSSAAPEVFTIMADGLLDLGTSIITIREVNGDANFLLETTNGGDIDSGSSTVTFDAVSNTTVTSTIRADGDILSTGALDYALDGTTLFQATNGMIDLPELDLEVLRANTTGGSSLTIDAQNGTLDLSDASIDVVGNTTLTSTGNMSLDNLNLIAKDLAGAPAEGNIAINSTDGSVTFVDGSVNNGAGLVETGTFVLTAAGPVSLGETDITVDVSSAAPEVFTIMADGLLDLGTSIITIREVSGDANFLLETTNGGDIDSGSSTVTFDAVSNTTVTSTIRADGDILSTGALDYALDGTTLFQANGLVDLPELDLEVLRASTTGGSSLTIDAQNGTLDLSDASIDVVGNTTLTSTGNMSLDNLNLIAKDLAGAPAEGNIAINSTDGSVTFVDGSVNNGAGLVETGTFVLTAAGPVSLGETDITVDVSSAAPEVFTIMADGLLDLGTSIITIREVSGDANFLLETTNGGDIDLGSSTVTFDAVSNTTVTSTIRADGDILSTGALDYALDGTTLFQANGLVDLPELDLEVLRASTTGGSSLTIDAQNGTLDLSDASIDVVGNTTLTSTGNMSLDNLNLIAKDLAGAPAEGNIAINSTGGSVTFVDGSVNNVAGLVETGTFVLTAAGPVSLGETDITVDVSSAAPEVFTIMADGLLDLGTSIITIREVNGDANFLLETTNGGDIDLGSSTVTFDAVSNTTVTSTIRADGDILSTGALDYALDGTTLFQATNGMIDLPELDLEVLRANTTGGSSLTIDAQNGTLDLSDASIDVVGNTTLTSTGNMSLDNLNLIAKDLAGAPAEGNIAINSTDGSVTFVDGSVNNGAGLVETGTFVLTAAGPVSLGETDITVDVSSAAPEVFTIMADGLLDLGTSIITIREVSGDANFLLETTNGGDIDLGSSTVTFDAVSNTTVTSTIRADGDILSTGALDYALDGTTLFQANGLIDLPELDLEVLRANTTGGSSLTIDAQNGTLDLSDASIDVVGNTTLTSTGNMSLDNLNLIARDLAGAPAEGNIAINSTDGSVTFVDGSVNNGAGLVETGTFVLTAAGPVSLGETDITVDVSSAAPEVFTIMADGLLDLGTSIITIREVSGDANFLLETTNGGDIDLGSSTVTFDAVSNTTVTSTIRADGSILSDSDGNSTTSAATLALDGFTLIQATTGDLNLSDVSLTVNQLNTNGSSLDLVAESGNMNLGESVITSQNNIGFRASGILDAQSSTAIAPNQVTFASNTEVRSDGSGIQAGDIEIFGYDPMTGILSPNLAVPAGVTLDLFSATNIDLSVLSGGDIVITHTGGGTLTTERAGTEGVGTPTSPSSLSSTGGSISVTSDGSVLVGKSGGMGAPLISATATDAVVSVAADRIVDAEGGSNLDILSGGTVALAASTSIGDTGTLEVQGQSVIVDVSSAALSTADVTILGSTQYLEVAGNQSDIDIIENASGNQFDLFQATNGSRLTLPTLTIDDIYYRDVNSVELNGLSVGSTQSVAVEALNGDITNNFATGNVVTLDGELLLVASGDVGDAASPITVSGGTVATRAGGDTFVYSDSDALTVGQVVLQDHLGAQKIAGTGATAGGNIKLKLTAASPTQLIQDEDIVSTGGDVAIDLVNGSLIQADDKTIGASTLAIRTGGTGTVGDFDGAAVQDEVNIDADALVLDIAGDAILQQQGGDLSLVDQVTIGGELYTTTGAAGDLRVRAPQGGISLDTDIDAGGQAAFVTGNNLVLGQGPLPNSITVNGTVTAIQSIVLLSAGNINYSSGSLVAPQVGLGAVGTIGSAALPVQLETDELSTAPFEAEVNDPTGFVTVSSVSAVGVTVNQAAPLPDPPPEPPVVPPLVPPVEPVNPFPPGTDISPEVIQSIISENEFAFDETFAQNQTDLIEDALRTIEQVLIDDLVDEDPTRPPILWPEEDFLKRKFRR